MRETSEDFEETIPPRQIDFSKWVKGYGSETTSNEGRVWEDKSRANDRESDNETCMSLSVGEILESVGKILEGDYFDPSNLLDESDLPSSFPCPYSVASDLDHQKPPLEQAVTCSQTEPEPWTMAFVEKVLEGDYSEPSNLLDESDPSSSFSPCSYPRRSNLDHQEPSLEEAVSARQTEPDLWTMGHKESALVEPLLSTEGESTANRISRKPRKPPRAPELRKALNSLLFILINGSPNISPPKDPNFSSEATVYNYFNLWRKDGVLKSVLILLEEKAQEPLQSYYRRLLKNFQEASNPRASLPPLNKLKLKFDEPVKLSFKGVTDKQWLLIEPLLRKNERVTRRQKEKTEHWSISDQEWALVQSLLSTKGESLTKQRSRKPRKALNSLLFVLMSRNPNISLPKNPSFSTRATIYGYLDLWQRDRVLERVLALLEEEAQEPLKSHYQSLLKNFQEASNCQANRASLHNLRLKFDEIVELSFQGVTDKQWILIQPLLSKADHRPALNLIFSLLITGASSFASSSLTETNEAAEYLALWKKDGTLKNVLTRLIEVTQESVQSGYRKMLSHLQSLTGQPIPQLQPQPTNNEECDLMTDDQSDLDDQGSSPRKAVKRREDDPKLWRISDREWNLVQPLFDREIKTTGNPRTALNSILFILINGDSTPPKNPNFSMKLTADEYFLRWQTNKVLEKVLPLLEKESQEPLQSYYRKLLKNLQKISNPKTKPLLISNFKKKFGQAGSGFQCVTDRQWTLIDPLLNKKIVKCGRHYRRHLNSIVSIIMNGVPSSEIPVTSNFSGPNTFYKYFTPWKESETLKKVLTRLMEEAQGTVRSNYGKVLDRLQEGLSLHYMRILASRP